MEKTTLLEDTKLRDNFWVFGGLLVVLLVSILARDIDRPFTGLHSWAFAHSPWGARVHIKYGLSYTHGFSTRAVGYPPTENPVRYLDHPQLPALLNAGAMLVLGVNDWSLRVINIIAAGITLLLFLKILRHLADEKTALLAGLFFCLFPLTGYFGLNYSWLYPLVLCALWCYLVLIQVVKDAPKPKAMHKWGLAMGLFFALQISWEGFFFAMAIGVHYVCRCIYRKQFPDKVLLAILIVAPLSSLILNFTIMAAGHGWNYQWIIDLYKWRAGAGEMEEGHNWGKWFAKLWEHAVSNFSLPVLIIAITYLVLGQLPASIAKLSKKTTAVTAPVFPQFWLFLMPSIFQLFILKGCLWKHETWERPLFLPVSIAAALGVIYVGDIMGKIRPVLTKITVVVLVGIIMTSCVIGLNHYYNISHFSPAKVKLFKLLNKNIPPDKALLSFEDFIVNQHKAKVAFYRPEVAWYLDREIVIARSAVEIEKQARTGRFLLYLMPERVYDPRWNANLAALSQQLKLRYKFISIPADPGAPGKAPMYPYFIFDLRSKAQGY